MRKKLFFKTCILLILVVIVHNGYAQIAGTWKGLLKVQGMEIPLVFHLSKTDSGYTATSDSPLQNKYGIPMDKTDFANKNLHIETQKGSVKYEATLVNDTLLEGSFLQNGMSIPLNMVKTKNNNIRPQEPKPPFPYTSEDVSFENEKEHIKIAGTLTLPPNIQNPPIAVMITGSGQQDRNEQIFGHKPFWVIADYFARNGIGVLRNDDRGIGGTDAGNLRNATSADFATDVEAAVDFLHSKGYTHVGLIGHSEGGMIAPMIASRRGDIKFIILLAGPGISGDKIICKQTYLTSKSLGASDSISRFKEREEKKLIDFITSYKGNNLKEDFGNFYDAQFIYSPQMIQNKNTNIAVMTSPWYVYFIKYNPAPALEKTICPVLALNGTLDTQVPCEEDLSAIATALKKGGNKNFETRAMPGLNHFFQHAKTGSITESATIQETISPEVLQIMKDWILKNTK